MAFSSTREGFTGQATSPIPANAANGTMIPYYCSVHKGAMATPNATIKVDDSAQPGPAPRPAEEVAAEAAGTRFVGGGTEPEPAPGCRLGLG